MNKYYLTAMLLVSLCSQAFAQTSTDEVEKMTERFVSYCSIGSQAKDTSTFYLTEGQREMAIRVYNDIKAIPGVEFVKLDTNYYVYAKVAGNKKGVPRLCWGAHLDIAFEVDGPNTGHQICARVHRNYNGGVITLENGVVLSPDAPEGKYLRDHVGETIITSSGRSLLGGDNKCGCASLVELIGRLVKDDSPRGDNYFIFSQNEEVGLAAEKLDLTYLDAVPDMFIDVDGSDPGEVSQESFTGVNRTYRFYGNNAHTSDGSHFADARTAMAYFIGALPPEIHPSYSEGREGYVHCYSMKEVDGHDWLLSFRIRYFDRSDSLVFDSILTDAVRRTREAYDRVGVSLDTSFTQYDNFAYTMHKGTVDAIVSAAQRLGMPMRPTSLRAGTTSALLAAKGLPGGPCIFSGAHNEHSCLEWVSIEELCEITRLCNEVVYEVAKLKK